MIPHRLGSDSLLGVSRTPSPAPLPDAGEGKFCRRVQRNFPLPRVGGEGGAGEGSAGEAGGIACGGWVRWFTRAGADGLTISPVHYKKGALCRAEGPGAPVRPPKNPYFMAVGQRLRALAEEYEHTPSTFAAAIGRSRDGCGTGFRAGRHPPGTLRTRSSAPART